MNGVPTPQAFAVEVALGNGRSPEWRVVTVQARWDASHLARHALALLDVDSSDPGARCFSLRNRLEPVTAISQVRAGDRLLLTQDGQPPVPYAVLACGRDDGGEMGLGAAIPTIIPSLSAIQIVQVACGRKHTVALTKDGTVMAFGCAQNGRLGQGETTAKCEPSPRRVELPERARGIGVACGDAFSLVVGKAREEERAALFCFGMYGPWLGIGRDEKKRDVWNPVKVRFPEGDGVAQVACNETHSIAVTEKGLAFSWGVGGDGKLGHILSVGKGEGTEEKTDRDGGIDDEPLFRKFEEMEDVFVDEREAHVGVLLPTMLIDKLFHAQDACSFPKQGRMHAPTSPSGPCYTGPFLQTIPLAKGMMAGMFDAEEEESLENLRSDTQDLIFVLPDLSDVYQPKCILLLRGFLCSHSAAGGAHSLVVDKDGRVFAFGQNKDGQLGLGPGLQAISGLSGIPIPVQIRSCAALLEHGALKVQCGKFHSVALCKNSKLYSWGGAFIGREEDEPSRPSPVLFEGAPLIYVKDVACGDMHTVCCTTFGHVIGFGENGNCQLGRPSEEKVILKPTLLQTNTKTANFYLSDGNNLEDRLQFLSPEHDPNLIISSVSAGGGAEKGTGRSVFLSCSLLNEGIWARFSQPYPEPWRPPSKGNKSSARDFCIAWPGVSSSSSSDQSNCLIM